MLVGIKLGSGVGESEGQTLGELEGSERVGIFDGI